MNLRHKLSKLPPNTRRLIKRVSLCAQRHNFRIYLVGGIVRDLIMGRANFDLDIVVEQDALKFAKYLAHTLSVDFRRHHSFGTATVFSMPHKIDLATSRRESYACWGALPKVEAASLGDDLRRRDFTINAMALSLNKDNFAEVIDCFGGVSDLGRGFIRIIHKNSFLEDPTRILRALRFKERFSFKFEPLTLGCFKEAAKQNALSFVNPHRLRDEIILILQEQEPIKCIRSLNRMIGLNFLGVKRLGKKDFLILERIKRAIVWFDKKFSHERKLDAWLIYLMAILRGVKPNKLKLILSSFAFKKGERTRLLHAMDIKIISKLASKRAPSEIYRLLKPLSFETIIFFYALSSSKRARQNIEKFLSLYNPVRIKIKGETLKQLGIQPSAMYGKIFKKILHKKIDGKIKSREDELREIKRYLR